MNKPFTNAFETMDADEREIFYKTVFMNMNSENAFSERKAYYKSVLKHMGENVYIGIGVKIVNPQYISIGDNVKISDNSTIIARGEGGITLGKNVVINDRVYLDTENASTGYIYIGDYAYIGTGTTLFGHVGLVIGDHALLAQNISLTPYSHIFKDPDTDIIMQGGNMRKVTIGRDSYIGMGVCILYSADIGTGSVIGAGSVVVKSVPDYCIAVGNPARIVNHRIKNDSAIFPEKYLIHDFSGEEGYGREPVLGRMEDGSLAAMFLSGGTHEPARENCVLLSRSTDDGATWTKPTVVFNLPERAVWATEIFTQKGQLPFAAVQSYIGENDYREVRTFRSFTHDNGKTWSSPVSFHGIDGVIIRSGVTLSGGEILFPVYWAEVVGDFFNWQAETEFDKTQEKMPYRCGVIISSDGGKTFSKHGYITGDKFSLFEPAVAEISPGHLLMLMRPNGNIYRYAGNGCCDELLADLGPHCIYRSESFDAGRTWSKAEETNLPNPSSLIVLQNIHGKLILINNFNCNDRLNLELHTSSDGGKTWTKKLEFGKNGERFFYPNVMVDEEKRLLYVAYENARQHYLTKIPFSLFL